MIDRAGMSFRRDGIPQPGPCKRPLLASAIDGYPNGLSHLFVGEAGEVVEFDDLGRLGIFGCQSSDRLVECEQLVGFGVSIGDRDVGQIDAVLAPAVANPAAATCPLNQDSAHGLGGGGIEVSTIGVRRAARWPDQSHERFVDKRGRIESLPGALRRELSCRRSAQVGVNQRQQAIRRLANCYRFENPRHVFHKSNLWALIGSIGSETATNIN